MTNIEIKEVVTNNLRTLDDGQVLGHIKYTYESPTHWSSGGVCTIIVGTDFNGDVSTSLNWGSGGINANFSDIEVADAMSKAFAMASIRLNKMAYEQEDADVEWACLMNELEHNK